TAKVMTAAYLALLPLGRVLAQTTPDFGGELPNITGTAVGGSGKTRDSIVLVINFVLTFLALIAVIFVIVGGFRILVAAGNEEQVTKGRKTIIYAIIGLLVIFFARVIVGFFTGELSELF
ncbi:MAG: pilin, partial [Patescibacteria group bacterium]